MKQTNTGIEPHGQQGHGHLRFQDRVQVVEQRVPGGRRSEALPGQHGGSWTEGKPEIGPTWTPAAVAPETLWITAGKPDGNVVPKFPIDRCGASFGRQHLSPVRLVHDRHSELMMAALASADPMSLAISAWPF